MTSHCGKSARTNFFFGFSFASFFLLLLSSIIYGVWANRVPSTESTKGAAIFGACDLEGAIEVLFFWTMMMFSSTFFIFLFCWCSPSFSAVLFPGWRFHRRTKRGLFASFFFQETVLSIVIAITRARSFFFSLDWLKISGAVSVSIAQRRAGLINHGQSEAKLNSIQWEYSNVMSRFHENIISNETKRKIKHETRVSFVEISTWKRVYRENVFSLRSVNITFLFKTTWKNKKSKENGTYCRVFFRQLLEKKDDRLS